MKLHKVLPFFLIVTISYSEIIQTKQENVLEQNKIIKINKKEPPKEKKKIEKKEECSFWVNPIACTKQKYKEVVEDNKSISEVVLGESGGVEVEEQEEDKSIMDSMKESISSGSASLWKATKNAVSDAGSATKNFIKRKFDESWEESKREVARQKAERRKRALEARRKQQGK